MQNRLLLTLLALALTTGGCSLFGSKTDKEAVKLRSVLEVPPDLARPSGEDFSAAVPAERGPVHAANDQSAAVPGSTAAGDSALAPASRVRVERDGALRWLVVEQVPDQAFAQVRGYFVRNDMKLVVDSTATRQLETDWIEQEVNLGGNFFTRMLASLRSTGLRDKYRVRVEAGRTAGTSEIYVSHQGLEEIALESYNIGGPSSTWQPRKADPEAEARLLAKLMQHFGADTGQAEKQLAEGGATGVTRVKDQLILPNQDLDSAWRRIGLELDRAGVVIEDRDRTAGIYFVRFTDDGAGGKRGLFGFLGGDETLEERNKPKADRFQVFVKTVAEGISVSVRDVAGDLDRSPRALRLLDRIQAQLR